MWKHGRSAYIHHKCRCQICVDENNAYFRAYKRAYRKTDKYKAYQDAYIADYRERNHDALLAYSREYIREHRDEIREREQSPRGKAQHREGSRRRTARIRAQFIEGVDPSVLYRMWGGMCGICKEYVPEDEFQVDHRVPVSRGGAHGYINCQIAHPACNASKAAKLLAA